jgi:hypothetical protein
MKSVWTALGVIALFYFTGGLSLALGPVVGIAVATLILLAWLAWLERDRFVRKPRRPLT